MVGTEAIAGFSAPEALAPLFGWAFLGLSGAYLLRGATESGTIPTLAGVAAGILYAGWWIFLAARRAWANPVASTVHAVTAVLILTPLLWEATVRFHALSAALAALVLVAFTVFGLAIGWQHKLTGIACVATLAGLATSVALFRETHDAAAWAATVLAIAAAIEFSACRDHWLGLRWAAAVTSDLTILILTVLALRARDQTLVSGPLALGAQVALLGVYLISTADRTLLRRLPITSFEIGQTAAAFLVGIGGALSLQEVTSVGSLPVGLFCLGCSATCYVIAYKVVGRDARRNRNFYAYSTFGVSLMIVAFRVLLSASTVSIAWAMLAAALVYAGFALGRLTLRIHGLVVLLLASVASGAVEKAASWLIQTGSALSQLPDAAYAATLTGACLCCATMWLLGRRGVSSAEALLPAAVFA